MEFSNFNVWLMLMIFVTVITFACLALNINTQNRRVCTQSSVWLSLSQKLIYVIFCAKFIGRPYSLINAVMHHDVFSGIITLHPVCVAAAASVPNKQ
jgi:hypothetical protein